MRKFRTSVCLKNMRKFRASACAFKYAKISHVCLADSFKTCENFANVSAFSNMQKFRTSVRSLYNFKISSIGLVMRTIFAHLATHKFRVDYFHPAGHPTGNVIADDSNAKSRSPVGEVRSG